MIMRTLIVRNGSGDVVATVKRKNITLAVVTKLAREHFCANFHIRKDATLPKWWIMIASRDGRGERIGSVTLDAVKPATVKPADPAPVAAPAAPVAAKSMVRPTRVQLAAGEFNAVCMLATRTEQCARVTFTDRVEWLAHLREHHNNKSARATLGKVAKPVAATRKPAVRKPAPKPLSEVAWEPTGADVGMWVRFDIAGTETIGQVWADAGKGSRWVVYVGATRNHCVARPVNELQSIGASEPEGLFDIVEEPAEPETAVTSDWSPDDLLDELLAGCPEPEPVKHLPELRFTNWTHRSACAIEATDSPVIVTDIATATCAECVTIRTAEHVADCVPGVTSVGCRGECVQVAADRAARKRERQERYNAAYFWATDAHPDVKGSVISQWANNYAAGHYVATHEDSWATDSGAEHPGARIEPDPVIIGPSVMPQSPHGSARPTCERRLSARILVTA